MLGADELDPEDLDLIRYGLNCLAQMLPNKWEALSHSSYAIEHMITLLTEEKAMKSEHSFLGMQAKNMQLQAELEALAQETFNSFNWDLMDPILGF
ncbi:hypothetical protein N7453_004325 [Penicillium expansum]|nr:hypothetical protein N7453_004325 [Penicillium expansum]